MSVDSTTVTFAARNLDQQGVIRDLTLWPIISNMDTGEVYYTVELESVPDHVRIGRPVLVEVDQEDDHVIHLHPGALYQELYLPHLLYLVCPEERRGQWCRQKDNSVYECPCGARWDVFPEDLRAMEEE